MCYNVRGCISTSVKVNKINSFSIFKNFKYEGLSPHIFVYRVLIF